MTADDTKQNAIYCRHDIIQ